MDHKIEYNSLKKDFSSNMYQLIGIQHALDTQNTHFGYLDYLKSKELRIRIEQSLYAMNNYVMRNYKESSFDTPEQSDEYTKNRDLVKYEGDFYRAITDSLELTSNKVKASSLNSPQYYQAAVAQLYLETLKDYVSHESLKYQLLDRQRKGEK